MARVIEVTPDQLDLTAGTIENLAADYQAQYNALYNETNAMASSWQGKDNIAYINQINGFEDDLAKMHDLMIAYADYLRKTAKAYRDTQNAIEDAAKKLAN